MKGNIFIKRPVMAISISVLILAIGLISLFTLPVEQYPDIAPPTVYVAASYTGADAEAVMNSVIMPLEESINGVEDMMYITSSASNAGLAIIQVYFKQGTDPDMAAVNVQNRVAKAQGVVPGGDHDLVAVRNFIIQGAAKIKTGRLIGCCCAHRRGSFLFYHYSIPSFSLQFSNCTRWLDGIGHTLYNKGRFMGRDLYEVACARFLSGFCVHCRRLPGLLLPRLGGGCGPGVNGVLPHPAGK